MDDNPRLIYIIIVLLICFLPVMVAWSRWHRNAAFHPAIAYYIPPA